MSVRGGVNDLIMPCTNARLTVLSVVICSLVGCRSGVHSVDDVIARHTEAMGGRLALESINTIKFQLHIVDPEFEVDAIYQAMRPGRMRIDVVVGGEGCIH